MHTFFIFLQIFTLVLIFAALVLILHNDVTAMQLMMLCFLICILIQNMGYFFELMAKNPEEALIAVKVQYMGSCWTILFFSRFIYYYCRSNRSKAIFWVIAAAAITVFTAVITSEYHGLYYREMEFVTEADGFQHLSFVYGPVFYVFVIFCCGIPCLYSSALLAQALKHEKRGRQRSYYALFIVMSLLTLLTLLLYATKVIRVYDPCPAVIGIILSIVVICVWSRQNYDFSRAASDTVLSEMEDCVIMLDNERCITSYNPAAAAIFVTLQKEMLGKSIDELDEFPQKLLESNEKQEFELHGGYFEGRSKAVMDKRGTLRGYVITVFDITARQTYIEELTEMRKKAEAANLEKTKFLANMSHETRTPMNAVVGLSELIMEESRGRKVYDYARDIKSSVNNLLNVINNIMDISKLEFGKLELIEGKYDMAELIRDIAVVVEMNAKQKGLSFTYEMDEQLPQCFIGDDKRIRQILLNILDNAIKFTKKGHVRFTVTGRLKYQDIWELFFKIEDTGIGIDKEHLGKIFEKFKQVDENENRKEQGNGLGLSISQNLAHLMKGDIRVDSEYGEGSKFTVIIPQRAAVEVPEQESKKQEGDWDQQMFTAKDCRVLVVDDNLINCKVALGMLRPYEFVLDSARSGAEAIDLVKQNKYDIIFMDHMMPEMDGVEATHIIRTECGENGKSPVVVALTANALDGVREMFLANGFQDYLAKPVDRLPMHRLLLKWIPADKREGTMEEQPSEASVSLDDLSEIIVNGIDVQKVLEYHTGTLDEYVELLNLFYMDGITKVGYIRELAQRREWKNYRIEVHALKSASANLGAMSLSRKAKAQEEAAVSQDEEFIGQNFEIMLQEYTNLLQEIHKVLIKKGKQRAVSDEPREPITEEELVNGIKEALELVEHFKSKPCAEKVEWLLEHQVGEKAQKVLNDVSTKLKMYDDDSAEDLLRELLNSLGGEQKEEER